MYGLINGSHKWDMISAGIDVSKFSLHNTRMAATSKAKVASVPMDEILNTAGSMVIITMFRPVL